MYENSSYLIDASKVLRGEDTTFDNLWVDDRRLTIVRDVGWMDYKRKSKILLVEFDEIGFME